MRRIILATATLALAATGVAASATPVKHPAGHITRQVFRGAGGEPNVTISPSGRYVLADGLGGSSDPSTLYRSADFGHHFVRVHQNTPNVGGEDWDMHFVGERTVVAADLSLGTGIYVDVSTDAGVHWRQTTIATDVYDRPWVAAKGNRLYVVAKGFDGVPYLFRSADLGRTFDRIPIVIYGTGVQPAEAGGTSPTPSDALVTNQNAYVDNLTVDPRSGDVYVLYGIDAPESYPSSPPLGAPDRLYVAHLVGNQMVSHPVTPLPGNAADAFYAGFNWMTVDRAGTVYVLGNGRHAGHQSAWLSYSRDRGAHWSRLVDVGTPHVSSVYGAITGGATGRLGLVYYEGTKADANQAQNWYATMAWVTHANTARPTVHRARVVSAAVHTKDICLDGILCGVPGFGDNRNLLDYIDDALGPDGSLWGAFSSDGPATGGDSHDGLTPSVILVHAPAGPRI